uniref:Secreted protein n=1 Tax=Panagrellus redivivus TaxID=6233 RepID=A0A7E5A1P6_PANRE
MVWFAITFSLQGKGVGDRYAYVQSFPISNVGWTVGRAKKNPHFVFETCIHDPPHCPTPFLPPTSSNQIDSDADWGSYLFRFFSAFQVEVHDLPPRFRLPDRGQITAGAPMPKINVIDRVSSAFAATTRGSFTIAAVSTHLPNYYRHPPKCLRARSSDDCCRQSTSCSCCLGPGPSRHNCCQHTI